MPTDVHSLMKNPHDINPAPAINCAIEDHIATDAALAVAFAYSIARKPKVWIVRNISKAFVDGT